MSPTHRFSSAFIRRFIPASSRASTTSSPIASNKATLLRRAQSAKTGFAAPNHTILRATASATAAAVLAMAAYSGTVTKTGHGVVPDDFEAKPHHVTKHGEVVGFKNPHPSFGGGVPVAKLAARFIWGKLTGRIQPVDTTPPTVPVVAPTFLPTRTGGSEQLRATWLGHACYYVEYPSGLRVLFDPVFEDRCSPFSWMGPKRFTDPPCAISELPFVDAVVISHSHYDHLSHPSVLEVAQHFPKAHFFVGMGLEKWFRAEGLKNVTELDWWEDAEVTFTLDKKAPAPAAKDDEKSVASASGSGGGGGGDPETVTARFSALPCQHTSARTAFDRDTTLWCSWGVSSPSPSPADAASKGASGSGTASTSAPVRSVWFGGDTGYRAIPVGVDDSEDDYGPAYESLPRCPQFAQIGQLRGPFDLGLIPIGAYKPRTFFSAVHANPYDAVEIMRDTRCARAMGIHWGTWVLTTEAVKEPPQMLREALKKRGMPETGAFDVCDIGESREF